MTAPPTVALVLGAGGTLGGEWIRGALDGLRERTGFTANQAAVLQGTSIGAFITGRIGPSEPLTGDTFTELLALAAPPTPPSLLDRAVTVARLGVGAAVALASPPGRADPRTWVEEVRPDAYGRVVSLRCRPPQRRVADLGTAEDPRAEIAASGAVPVGAEPVVLDGARHCDGAVWSFTNADLVGPEAADLLIVITPRVTTDGGSPTSWTGRHQLRVELAPWARAAKPCIVIAPTGAELAAREDRTRHRADARAHVLARTRELPA